MTAAPHQSQPECDELVALEAECERLHKLAQEAPLNPYRLDADGHRWVEQYSSAWATRSNDWVKACERRDALRRASQLSRPTSGDAA